MIDLSTLAGLYEHQHDLAAYCPRCERWRTLDLELLLRQGKGGLRLPWRVRCLRCGELGEIQVRPQMPRWGNPTGWAMPAGA
jgi:hypothetical protein